MLETQTADNPGGKPLVGSLEQPTAPPHLKLLRILFAAAILSSVIHYTHNFVKASLYPPLPPLLPNALAFQIGIAIAWPLLTGVGIWGYAQYAAGNLREAGWAFVAYSVVGISSIGHFSGPTPHIPLFFFMTIFTDFFTGAAMLGFAVVTLKANRS